ncbi:MAG TPA: hypothetical protein VNR36_13860 [Pseudolysinimonas sp.]|nr:hypothetical protein [Pseudolysinimonas sp.]
MRWEHLFDDLESQLEHELGAEEVDLLAEEERLRLGRLALRDRLRAMMGRSTEDAPLRLMLVDGSRLALNLGAVGRDWVAGEQTGHAGSRRSCVVPTASIAALFPDAEQLRASMSEPADGAAGSLASRLGLAFVLRDLCRRRAVLDLATANEVLHGTIDRVARDHVDLAEHEPGTPRRESAVRAVRLVPLDRIVSVRF